MLRPRIIPCLLIHNRGLVKTTRFTDPKYVGDPLNAVKIFNEKEVDELFVADIDATVNSQPPDFELISRLAAECRMPLCYAGGVKSVDDIKRIVSLGVEKVAISSAALSNPKLIEDAAKVVGSQSIVVVLDIKKSGLLKRYEVFTHNGKRKAKMNLFGFLRETSGSGVGEFILNSIDRDGTLDGYDHNLVEQVRDVVSQPLSVVGGAGSLDDIRSLVKRHGIIGAGAGSMFVFKGKYRAVLIQYPTRDEKDEISSWVS